VFWYLLFAHFIADYPLQSNWMVLNKTRLRVLVLHVLIHLLISSIIVIFVAPGLLIYVLLSTFIHFVIDATKNYANNKWPNWVVLPYFIDQILHVLSILLIALLISNFSDISPFALKPPWMISLTALLVVTYVWYISERILSFNNQRYFQQVLEKEWSRMTSRAILCVIFFSAFWNLTNTSILIVGFAQFPYQLNGYGFRALLTDLFVSFSGAAFLAIML
jgi:hypothetical protein